MTSGDYDAIVYDLDGTLVGLDVDWNAVARDVSDVLSNYDVDTDEDGIWAALELTAGTEVGTSAEEAIAAHERKGAETATSLPLAADLPHDVPVGICSLNCEAACHAALARHDLDSSVDVVIGRDTVTTFKPDPEPLMAAVDGLDVDPSRALFVGDSRRDMTTADRAGIDFQWVNERRSPE